MATYLYRCPQCDRTHEHQHKMTESPVIICVHCSLRCVKVIQPAGVIFKGSGFYVNDYKNRSA